MYMQKKIYVAPNFEVYNMEPESMLAGSVTEGVGGPDGEVGQGGGQGGNDMGTQKKQYGFNSAPWE
jgi:hypothetical protein